MQGNRCQSTTSFPKQRSLQWRKWQVAAKTRRSVYRGRPRQADGAGSVEQGAEPRALPQVQDPR